MKIVELTEDEVKVLRWLAQRYATLRSEPPPFELSVEQRLAAAKSAEEKLA